jgi:hypothetical protein
MVISNCDKRHDCWYKYSNKCVKRVEGMYRKVVVATSLKKGHRKGTIGEVIWSSPIVYLDITRLCYRIV